MSVLTSTFAGARLLLVEDDEPLRNVSAEYLRAAGFRVLEASDGVQALELWQRESPDLILLDVTMPRLNGWQTLEKIRFRGGRQPVLMLTGLVSVDDRVKGLGAGADDYLGKPCDVRELIARINALLRRTDTASAGATVLRLGEHVIDLVAHTATTAGQPLALTRTEFAILDLLARHAGRPVSRETILDGVWGYTHRPNTRTVETHLWRLRKKLGDRADEPRWIQTAGGGYRLAAEGASVAAA
jgi:DNA-binding response OmpR family regulator